jgi:type IV pilus assembly protein PilZ
VRARAEETPVIEKRRYARAPFNIAAAFVVKGGSERHDGLAKDISVGGVFVETASPASFGAEVVVYVVLPGTTGEVALPGVVRWVRDGGMGVQFGLLGAKETHAITEIGRRHSEAPGS